MPGDREVTSEQSSSVHEGECYDEVYPSGHGPKKGSYWLSKKEPFAHSLNGKEDFNEKGVEEKDEYDEGEGENEEEYEEKGENRSKSVV